MTARNQVVASGRLNDLQPVRYTPAGIPVVEFCLQHESTQTEAGKERQVQCEIRCLCLGDPALKLARLTVGDELVVKGFLAARHRRFPHHLVLHVADYKRLARTEPPVF